MTHLKESRLYGILFFLTLCGMAMTILLQVQKIAERHAAQTQAARNPFIAALFPTYTNDPSSETLLFLTQPDSNVVLLNKSDALAAQQKEIVYISPIKERDLLLGWHIISFTKKGYAGHFTIQLIIDTTGAIRATTLANHNETPEFGGRAEEPAFKDQFLKKSPKNFRFEILKRGGDVTAISGATITSRAYCDALRRAYSALKHFPSEDGKKWAFTPDASQSTDSMKATTPTKEFSALTSLFPGFTNSPTDRVIHCYVGKREGAKEYPLTILPLGATPTVDQLPRTVSVYPLLKETTPLGWIVATFTDKGYGGRILMNVAISAQGTILGTEVLSHDESEGYGARMEEPQFKNQFVGKSPRSFVLQVRQEGGNVDAISRATITSRAYCRAIDRAYLILANLPEGQNLKLAMATPKPVKKVVPPKPSKSPLEIVRALFPSKEATPLEEVVYFYIEKNNSATRLPQGTLPTAEQQSRIVSLTPVKDKGVLLGWIGSSFARGYGGTITLLVALDPTGTILGTEVVSHQESEGYGMKMLEARFKNQFVGKKMPDYRMKLTKFGGDVEAISGATITSRAYCHAISIAYTNMMQAQTPPIQDTTQLPTTEVKSE